VVQDLGPGVVDGSSFQRKSIIKEWDGVKTEDFKIFYISTDLGPYFSWFLRQQKFGCPSFRWSDNKILLLRQKSTKIGPKSVEMSGPTQTA
jgi:hypothetical protein